MTPIVGALVLVAIVSIVFFTRSGRRLFQDACDTLDERHAMRLPIQRRRDAWSWNGQRKEWE